VNTGTCNLYFAYNPYCLPHQWRNG